METDEEKDMSAAIKITFSLILGGIVLAGCTTTTTLLEENRGRSVETANFSQRLNPHGDVTVDTAEGMDGISAINVLDGYHSGFVGQKSASSTGVADSDND